MTDDDKNRGFESERERLKRRIDFYVSMTKNMSDGELRLFMNGVQIAANAVAGEPRAPELLRSYADTIERWLEVRSE